jgi:hypothetical protein
MPIDLPINHAYCEVECRILLCTVGTSQTMAEHSDEGLLIVLIVLNALIVQV